MPFTDVQTYNPVCEHLNALCRFLLEYTKSFGYLLSVMFLAFVSFVASNSTSSSPGAAQCIVGSETPFFLLLGKG